MPIELLRKVVANIPEPVLVLGGGNDKSIGTTLEKEFENVKSYCGDLTLRESARVISKAKVALTADTGLMHIASAYQIPLVTVWGNTTPDFGMYPYMPENKELYKIHEVDLKCRPCSKIGYEKCPKKHFNCMNMQDEIKIVEDIKYFLTK